MEIYVVQPGDTIEYIAEKYNVSTARLIQDNGLDNPTSLVPGQTIVIFFPTKTYTVQEGDSLYSIATEFNITIMQLIRNNPDLYNRDYIYPGEVLIISYDIEYDITTNGFAYYFINRDTLKKTLPYLTFLSIFNYRATNDGRINSYGDDSDIINLAKLYKTIPLLMISTLSILGEANTELVYEILLNDDIGNNLIKNTLQTVQSKGFKGVNVLISSINSTNQGYYVKFLSRLSDALKKENYILVVTINPNITQVGDSVFFERLDYNSIGRIVYQLVFTQYVWGQNKQPPGPVSSTFLLRSFLEYIQATVTSNNISLGTPLIGYDWTLPYVPGKSVANAMTVNSTITLANDTESSIQFDDASQTPYFTYYSSYNVLPEEHIVWFIDARSIRSLYDLIIEFNFVGSGIWNINHYDQQLWSMINAKFVIIKIMSDH